MRVLKVILGAIIGLLVGSVLAFLAVGWQVRRKLPPGFTGQVGIDVFYMLRDPVFWIVLLLTIIVFAYLFSRIGSAKRHTSHL